MKTTTLLILAGAAFLVLKKSPQPKTLINPSVRDAQVNYWLSLPEASLPLPAGQYENGLFDPYLDKPFGKWVYDASGKAVAKITYYYAI